MSGVAFLYRWRVAPEWEEDFRGRWREATLRLGALGGLGSCLTRDADGAFVAFARWESEAARARAFAARGPAEPWPGIISFEETKLSVEADMLTAPPE
jgi:heme-degrading monooxygenase HmoA